MKTMYETRKIIPALCGPAAVCAIALLGLGGQPASAAIVSRTVEVEASPDVVWSMIGPFCAIATWHPAIGSCTQDGRSPPTRILLTRDGATFVELETARSDARHRYSYIFTSSPVPVSAYSSTIAVAAKAAGVSTVTWRGVYTPRPGHEQDADAALSGIYEAGLAAIRARLAR